MCHPSEFVTSTRRRGAPRWALLYGVTLPQLAALAVVEASSPAPPVRALLRWALGLGAFVAMALWLRANRAAFDQQDWCECAGRTMTVRVVESHPPLTAEPFHATALVAEEYEAFIAVPPGTTVGTLAVKKPSRRGR